MKLGEFFLSLVVNSDQKELDDFNGGLKNLDKTLNQLKLVATGFALKAFTDSTIDATVAVQNFNNQTGLMIEGIQRWQSAGVLSDLTLTADAVASSVASLQDNLTQIKLGGGNVSPFQLLGIDVAGKTAFQVLDDIKNAIKGLDSATATNLIQQTGLSPQFINILRLSNEEFDKLSEQTFLNKDQRENVLKLGTSFAKLGLKLVALKDQIVAGVAPALIRITDAFTWVSQGIIGFISVTTEAGEAINVFKAVILGVFLAIGVALFPVTTALLALVVIFEDLVTWIRGGDSAIGAMIANIKKLGSSILDYVLKPFKEVKAIFDKITGGGEDLKVTNMATGEQENSILQKMFGGGKGGGSVSANVNNTFNVSSSADAGSVANKVVDMQQNSLNHTMQELNNGTAN
tara:strand:- start:2090 stop:3298 length:1209 start_codon:yes stop_codon:yes gene_type:complete